MPAATGPINTTVKDTEMVMYCAMVRNMGHRLLHRC